ncbi:hypothetical protein QLQ12_37750 [Actinoplanes sp. NEAU-A12]|uniref:Galactokinase n=1 Tax=Actinoplanes sandaracinus TaxID=3045177 RepID=A0ABT6WX82_9ACTN|nr:hypothetical protein [Actinoplanes sandaracinus]MDI6104351.1 hypothetical protein [Actinoplanes sandaracinus]
MTNGPSVVAAVPLYTTVTVTPDERNHFEVTLASPLSQPTERVVLTSALRDLAGDDLDMLQAAAAVVAERWAVLLGGARLAAVSNIPMGAGVSSSAALTLAAAGALMRFADATVPSAARVAKAAYQAESELVGTGAGWMDFLACAHGGVCRIEAGSPPRLVRLADTLGVPLVLIDTQQRRATATVLASKRERWQAGDPAMRDYAASTTEIVSHLASALQQSEPDYRAVGTLMTDAHQQLRDLVRCSTPLIDECVARCLASGAYGAKLTGSGYGGCLVALAPIEQIGVIHAALADLPVRVMVFTTGEPHGLVFPPSDY